jgi:molybdopterin converting factor small subunit
MAKIQLIGPLEEQVGIKEIYIEGETIKNVLEKFIKDYRQKLEKFIDPKTGFFNRYLMILVNRQNYIFLKDKLDTYLKSDDEIILALPIGGGSTRNLIF